MSQVALETPLPAQVAGGTGSEVQLSIAIGRIAIGIAALIMMHQLAPDSFHDLLRFNRALPYQPKGLLALYGTASPPPAIFFECLRWVGYVATVTMIVGLFSRTSTFLSMLCGVLQGGIIYGFRANVCHGAHVILLTQMVAMFVPPSGVLSVDAWLRRRFFPSAGRHWLPGRYAIFALQISVASMFAAAAFQKILGGGFSLAWADAQNFQMQLIKRFALHGDPFPPRIEWLMQNAWACHLLALGNLFSQLCPLLACIFFKMPRVRMFFGSFFLLEVFGLMLVMDNWNWQFAPLWALFLDWEYLGRLVRARFRPSIGASPTFVAPAVPTSSWRQTFPVAAMSVVLVAIAVASFFPNRALDTLVNIYPFTNYSMYSQVYERGNFKADAYEYEILSNYASPEALRKAEHSLQHNTKNSFKQKDPRVLGKYLKFFAHAWRELRPTEIRAYRTTYSFSTFPRPYRQTAIARRLLGSYTTKGDRYLTAAVAMDPSPDGAIVKITPSGYSNPDVQLFTSETLAPDGGDLQPLVAEARDGSFQLAADRIEALKGRLLYARVDDEALAGQGHVYLVQRITVAR